MLHSRHLPADGGEPRTPSSFGTPLLVSSCIGDIVAGYREWTMTNKNLTQGEYKLEVSFRQIRVARWCQILRQLGKVYLLGEPRHRWLSMFHTHAFPIQYCGCYPLSGIFCTGDECHKQNTLAFLLLHIDYNAKMPVTCWSFSLQDIMPCPLNSEIGAGRNVGYGT